MKHITFSYNGSEYNLEYTRDTVKQMENKGLTHAELDSHPLNTIPELFYGAFLAHHRYIGRKTAEEILDHMPNKEQLFATLLEMYLEPVNALFSDPEESEGNVKWEISE